MSIGIGGDIPTCEECGGWLTGRQTRYCSKKCNMRAYRRAMRPDPKVCDLCGAEFVPLRGNQRICDYMNEADSTCSGMQMDRDRLKHAADAQRWEQVCIREGCNEWTGWEGAGRPRRFCSNRCKTAHYRAATKETANV